MVNIIFFKCIIMKKINDIFKKISEVRVIKNHFWLIFTILFIVSIFISLKLFWLTWDVWFSCSGWFISLCLMPEIWYLPWWNTIISVILLIFLLNIYNSYKDKKTVNYIKLKSIIIIFLISLLAFPIFNFLSPELWFVFKKAESLYYDRNGNIEIDKYLDYMVKYCIDDKYDTCYKWKFQSDLWTVDNYIKALEIAKNNDFRKLYSVTISWIEDAWLYKKMIEKYNDKTFYTYVIVLKRNNIELMNLIKDYMYDENIESIMKLYTEKWFIYKDLLEKWEMYDSSWYWWNVKLDLYKIIKEANWINYNIF